MVEINITYEGDLRCQAVHGPSGQGLFTDAPVDNHGKGQSFSPTDLVATALGTCMATIMGILADREGWDLRGMRIRVVKEMVSQPCRRIGRLRTTIVFPPGLSSSQRDRLEAAARACPVHQSLGEQVEMPLEFLAP